jgi:formylglycine-generating enzyme required for sulfatase activity
MEHAMSDAAAPTSMVICRGGTFCMGTPSSRLDQLQQSYQISYRDLFTPETPQHEVELAPFAIDTHPVTNAQFLAFLMAQPEWQPDQIAPQLHNGDYLKHWDGMRYPDALADHPVVYICWYAAVAYAAWVKKRLPTEAEWEYAARAEQADAEYPWGAAPADPSRANYAASGVQTTTAVGSYPPNPYGIFDLAGNVWEYCLDEWQPNYDAISPRANPIAGDDWLSHADATRVTTRRVIRGGSWGGDPVNLRLTYRDSHPPTGAGPHVGFRCARSLSDVTLE